MEPVTDSDLFAGNSSSDTNSSSCSDKQSEQNIFCARKEQSEETRKLTTRQLRRIRHTKRCKFTFNRLVKDDLRRQFPIMFCNVINQANTELSKSFLTRYLLPDCDVLTDPMPTIGVPSLHLKGPTQFAEYMELVSVPLPDFTTILLGGRVIRQFYEETSILEMFMKLKATRLVYSQCSAWKSAHMDGEECCLSVASEQVDVEDLEVHIKSSFEMNSEGVIVKVTHGCSMFIPAFLSIPLMNEMNPSQSIK